MIGHDLDMDLSKLYLCYELFSYRYFSGPLSPAAAAFDSSPFLNNGPICYSLLDSQYPLFSDMCGAVPQARYSLPNSFGHVERWQIAQILTAILGPATPACTRSLRLLLCPLLFPPCPKRYEAPPVLPCQPFCRGLLYRIKYFLRKHYFLFSY